MSMPPRPAKCARYSRSREGQAKPPVQRATASPGRRVMGLPQKGQSAGIAHTRSAPVRSEGTGPTTSGMTSPARRMTTMSPTRRSLRAISSWLCRVALVMVAPPTNTGSSTA